MPYCQSKKNIKNTKTKTCWACYASRIEEIKSCIWIKSRKESRRGTCIQWKEVGKWSQRCWWMKMRWWRGPWDQKDDQSW